MISACRSPVDRVADARRMLGSRSTVETPEVQSVVPVETTTASEA